MFIVPYCFIDYSKNVVLSFGYLKLKDKPSTEDVIGRLKQTNLTLFNNYQYAFTILDEDTEYNIED